MRHHGWELPYHPLQIVAVAVFFALVFGFYVFFVPFTGSRILEILIIAVYSPTIVVVFVVYVWCVATNPADVGVRICKKRVLAASSVTSSRADGKEKESTAEPKADKRTPPLHLENQNAGEVAADDSNMKQSSNSFSRVLLPGLAYLVQICTHKSSADPLPTEHGILYCTLCKVEIFKYSKHCRVCDKCVDGFDHHCRWLNNCVGRKNYRGFVILMVSGIIMLILQWSVGLWVLVHFFLNLKHFKNIIASKLGSSFSSIAYLIVMALCTLLAMAATYPLVQLFCFHVLLMKKGISTFDYIIAMKEQQHKVGGESAHSPLTSPASSIATANSGASSSGVLQGRAWCTPPRLFFDHEQGIFPPESSHPRKNIDQGLSSRVPAEENLKKKTSVKLSSWALASLKKEDVLHAATLARNKSSILHPVAPSSEKQVVTEASSSYNSSKGRIAEFRPPLEIRSTNRKLAEPNPNRTDQAFVVSSWQNGKLPLDTFEQQDGIGKNSGNTNKHIDRGKKVLNPVQMEARNAFKTSREFSVSGNPVSSPESSGSSSEAPLDMLELPHPSVVPTDWPWIENSVTGGYDGSGCESTDDSEWAKNLPHAMIKEKVLSDARRGSLQYSPRREVFGPEISGKSSTFSPRTGDGTRVESSIIPNADGADEHLSRMAAANDVASQKGSLEKSRISKYTITDPSHLHFSLSPP